MRYNSEKKHFKKKKEDISHDNRLKQFTVNCFQKIWIQINLLSSTVKQL